MKVGMVLVTSFIVPQECEESINIINININEHIHMIEEDTALIYEQYNPEFLGSSSSRVELHSTHTIRYDIYTTIEFNNETLNLMKLKNRHLYELLHYEEELKSRILTARRHHHTPTL